MSKYEAVIGLECHAQLLTQSKLFCSCSTRFGDPPNTNTCPVCLGLPGALPVLNRQAVTLATRAAIGLQCVLNTESQWSRKNYFYPDLPKGYQISQYDRPLANNGVIDIGRAIRIRRVHMEEDAGRSLHEGFPDSAQFTYLDFNRSGVPLIEIVSEPEIRNAAEAHVWLACLKQILEYLDVCDGNMEEGSLRCDANVSVRPAGRKKLGTRTEIKNINSFRFVEKAIDFEIERQIDIIQKRGRVTQETRLWDSREERTVTMRSKEEEQDYRYFPEPDLPLLTLNEAALKEQRRSLAELPDLRRRRLAEQYSLSGEHAAVLTTTRALADFFEATAAGSKNQKAAANWIIGDLLRFCNESGMDLKDLSKSPISPAMLSELIMFVDSGTVSGKMAKAIFEEMWQTGAHAGGIIEKKALAKISDSREIEHVVERVIARNASNVEQYRSGKTALVDFFIGQVMKETGGRADPQTVDGIVRKKLAG